MLIIWLSCFVSQMQSWDSCLGLSCKTIWSYLTFLVAVHAIVALLWICSLLVCAYHLETANSIVNLLSYSSFRYYNVFLNSCFIVALQGITSLYHTQALVESHMQWPSFVLDLVQMQTLHQKSCSHHLVLIHLQWLKRICILELLMKQHSGWATIVTFWTLQESSHMAPKAKQMLTLSLKGCQKSLIISFTNHFLLPVWKCIQH